MSAVLAARNAVGLTFFLNGLCFATWASRIPQARTDLELSNGQLGLLLLAIAAGSVLALPTTGTLIERFGTVPVVRSGAVLVTIGLLGAAVGIAVLGAVAVAAVALFVYGIGVGVWDVGMNVEGAAVERGLRRTIMPRFHAGFSLGTVLGALGGAAAVAVDVSMAVHLGVIGVISLALVWTTTPRFLPDDDVDDDAAAPRRSAWLAWLEPRTLVVGIMVLALALAEGTANDWLAVALSDGYDVPHWVGVAGLALFVSSMTAGRMAGTLLLDRFGRVPVLWGTMAAAGVGVVLIVVGGSVVPVVLGILLWGAGASLGFPVGMSAAADEPEHAAARVSVVSTIGYGAFLAGPPLLGFVGDEIGTLASLLVVAVVLVPAALAVPLARPLERAEA